MFSLVAPLSVTATAFASERCQRTGPRSAALRPGIRRGMAHQTHTGRVSATARAGAGALILLCRLRRPVQVARSRVRRGLVRLRDGSIVPRAQHPDRSVGVRRVLLDGCGECRRVLLVRGRLSDDLAPGTGAGLVLPGRLLGPVRVPAVASEDAVFDCVTPAGGAGAASLVASDESCPCLSSSGGLSTETGAFSFVAPFWSVSAARKRILLVRGRLADDLRARPTLALARRLRRPVHVPSRRVRGSLVRLRDRACLTRAENLNRAVLVGWSLLRCPSGGPCGLAAAGCLAGELSRVRSAVAVPTPARSRRRTTVASARR